IAASMATCLQAAVLIKHGDSRVADACCASRLAGDWGGTFGTLPRGLDLAGVVARTTPHLES
ncbi:MAG: DNA alkylation response protein, partial [Aeromicrobium sp.]